MNVASLAGALMGHFVGDYLIQNDWMALNKKRDAGICLVHAALWTLSVLAFAGWLGPGCAVVGAILVATHFWQDHTNVVAWWMDRIGQRQFRTGPCAPWSIIVVDNVWHVLTIYLLWRFVA